MSESWSLSDVLLLRLPRKSEIATGLERSRGRGRSERGRSEGSEAKREKGEEEGVGRQETDDQDSLPTPPPHPSCTKILVRTALFAFLSSSPHPTTPTFKALIAFRLAVQHHNQHFMTILRTFYPNTVPLWSLLIR